MKDFMKTNKHGFSLVEVLIASILIAACIGGILAMAVGGRKSTEYEVRYLQALTIAKAVARELDRAAICDLSILPSEPAMLPLVASDGASSSIYGLRLFQDRRNLANNFPTLANNLGNFGISVDLSPFQSIDESRAATIIVYFKLSKGQQKLHKLTFNSLIVRHSPI